MYKNSFLPLLWQFFLIPTERKSMWISECNLSPHLTASILLEFQQNLAVYAFSNSNSNANTKN
jgi:hypothetical protein